MINPVSRLNCAVNQLGDESVPGGMSMRDVTNELDGLPFATTHEYFGRFTLEIAKNLARRRSKTCYFRPKRPRRKSSRIVNLLAIDFDNAFDVSTVLR